MKKLTKIKKPSYKQEAEKINEFDLVFGMDEVGRGSFAGPLVAAAVAFKKEFNWFKDINDSKLLAKNEREKLSKLILDNSISFIEIIDVSVINEFGVGEANRLIFENLVNKINKQFKSKNIYFLVDGNTKKINYKNVDFIVKGDQKCISIAASSIIAKVYRDSLMENLEKTFPGYNFFGNKGYGTKAHRDAIKQLGLSEIHRKSFKLEKFT